METFIERLENILKQNKITQTEIAEAINLRRPTISEWKKNGNVPAGDICCKIADFLNVSVEWLITGKDKSLSVHDRELLKKYNLLTTEQKEMIDNQIEFCFQKINNEIKKKA